MSDNITITGNIAGEIRHSYSRTGVPITTFRVASSQRRFDRATEQWIDGDPNWYSVSTYRGLAVNVYASLRKGERVIVTGRLRLREWEANEKRGISPEIDAESVGHDLLWGTTRFERTSGARVDAPSAHGGVPAESGVDPAASDEPQTAVDANGWAIPALDESGESAQESSGAEPTASEWAVAESTPF